MGPGRIGAYRITSELGRGGLGTVYRAVDPAGNAVAVKCLVSADSDDGATRLLQESSLRIEHPNVVRTLGGGIGADGRPYLVLELLEGMTLRQAFVGASPAAVVEWMRQAALGIAAIHAYGLVHRDVKPENLFLCRNGQIKVLDLGIAAWRDARSRFTATGAVVGTPAYLSPEQARGLRTLDPRADVWALGAVLYEGLAGQAVFRRDSMLATLLSVAIDPVPSLADIAPQISSTLAAIVARCLERNLSRRLASATLLAEALERTQREGRSEAPPSGSPSAALHERSVAIVLARPSAPGRAAFDERVRAADGEAIVLADGRAIGVFGAQVSRGDEASRALGVARALVSEISPIAVALGRSAVRTLGVRGEALREADEALSRAAGGIVCGPKAARALSGGTAVEEIAPGLFRIGESGQEVSTITPLLSRDAELAMLRRARDTAVSESSLVTTFIVGAPGAGKTRLAEVVRSLSAENDPPLSLREAHARGSGSGVLSIWHRALDLEVARPVGAVDATMLLDCARDALFAAVRALADRGPVTIVLEDMQWADPLSLTLIGELEHHVQGRPVWLVITGRPELLERLDEPPDRSKVVEPAPLTARDAMSMARARGRAGLTLKDAQALVAHTGGNPLFLELILDASDPRRSAEPAVGEGAWGELPLPPTVEYAVQARLDQLPEAERRALSALAVVGRAVTSEELSELGIDDAESSCEHLTTKDLAVRVSTDAGRSYRVRSPVVSTVAASLPSANERKALHRRAAEIAEGRRRDEEEIAQHREAAGDREGAAGFYLGAALAAVHGGDARKVLRCGARAMACGLSVRASFALHLARAEAARWVGDPKAQGEALDDADAAAETDSERALAASERGEWLRRSGDGAAALGYFDRAIELAVASSDLDTLVRAVCRRSIALVTTGRIDEAVAAMSSVSPDDRLSIGTSGLLEDTRGFVAGSTGDLGTRRAAFARAAELYRLAGDLRRAAGAESNAADASNRLGQYAVAETALRRGIELARRVGNRLTEGYALANLGFALAGLGRNREAREVLGEAQRIAGAIRDAHLRDAARLYACRADPGDDPKADGVEEVLAELAGGAQRSVVLRAGALALSARRALSRGEIPRALELSRAALSLVDEAGELEEGEAEVFLAALRAHEAAGRNDDARALLLRARDRLMKLAERIADPEARASFLEAVPEHRALLTANA